MNAGRTRLRQRVSEFSRVLRIDGPLRCRRRSAFAFIKLAEEVMEGEALTFHVIITLGGVGWLMFSGSRRTARLVLVAVVEATPFQTLSTHLRLPESRRLGGSGLAVFSLAAARHRKNRLIPCALRPLTRGHRHCVDMLITYWECITRRSLLGSNQRFRPASTDRSTFHGESFKKIIWSETSRGRGQRLCQGTGPVCRGG